MTFRDRGGGKPGPSFSLLEPQLRDLWVSPEPFFLDKPLLLSFIRKKIRWACLAHSWKIALYPT